MELINEENSLPRCKTREFRIFQNTSTRSLCIEIKYGVEQLVKFHASKPPVQMCPVENTVVFPIENLDQYGIILNEAEIERINVIKNAIVDIKIMADELIKYTLNDIDLKIDSEIPNA